MKACVDEDGDGHFASCAEATDCNDFDPRVPAEEVCNNRDDDCDGEYDEGFPPSGSPCTEGACSGITTCTSSGRVPTCVLPSESCDGVDDDCDGEIDEGVPDEGSACVTDEVGRCAEGRIACTDGAFVCVPIVEPGALAEMCDGRDDDCDGLVDEDAPTPDCYPGPPGTAGVGACRAGRRLCELGRLRTCVDAITPAPERCDGIDDDCDALIDEGLDCGCIDGELRPCPPRAPAIVGVARCVAGEQSCVDGVWGPCAGRVDPTPEVCDGVDDDCDGRLDEQPLSVDGPCTTGLGVCRAAGAVICLDGALRCDAPPGMPDAIERCFSGRDGDCDGVTSAPFEVGRPCVREDGDEGVSLCRSTRLPSCVSGRSGR